jgi:hypothetical protein
MAGLNTTCMCGRVAPLCEHCRRERQEIVSERLQWLGTTWPQRERRRNPA